MEKTVDKVNKKELVRPKERAIELWRETRGHISNICRSIGYSRTQFYNWLNEDPEFAKAIIEAEQELNDDVRDALIQKIADGDMTAITFYLKNRHPDFKPQPLVQIQNNDFNFIREDKEKYGQ